jgi:hypothetical protein
MDAPSAIFPQAAQTTRKCRYVGLSFDSFAVAPVTAHDFPEGDPMNISVEAM